MPEMTEVILLRCCAETRSGFVTAPFFVRFGKNGFKGK
jgi:hypothetical protein